MCFSFRKVALVTFAATAVLSLSAPAAMSAMASNCASTVTSDLSAYTTGNGNIYVVITLRDGSFAPVAGKTVNMAVTTQIGGTTDARVSISGNNVTDSNGQVYFTLSSGHKKVYDYGKAVDVTDSTTLPQTLLVDLPTAKY